MPQYFFEPQTAVVVAVATAIFVGIVRTINGGWLFDPDRGVRDGIAGVVLFVTGILWYGVVFDLTVLNNWSDKPLGMLTISMALFGLILSRLQTLYKSCMNRN